MARQLTNKQKDLLNQYSKKGCTCREDLTVNDLQRLVKIHDYETLYQDITRYLFDLYSKKVNAINPFQY